MMLGGAWMQSEATRRQEARQLLAGPWVSAMRILITNDDGVHAEGLMALKRALDPVAEVTVVAPDRPRSACGHSITLHKPLRLSETALADGTRGWVSNGTPSDCVTLAILDVMKDARPGLVFSGIDHGPNLGWDLTYSGTVSAAMEAAILGVQAVALSVAWRLPADGRRGRGPRPADRLHARRGLRRDAGAIPGPAPAARPHPPQRQRAAPAAEWGADHAPGDPPLPGKAGEAARPDGPRLLLARRRRPGGRARGGHGRQRHRGRLDLRNAGPA